MNIKEITLSKNKVIAVLHRTSQGAATLVSSIACKLSEQGHRVSYWTEEDAKHVLFKLISKMSCKTEKSIKSEDILDGKLKESELHIHEDILDNLRKVQIREQCTCLPLSEITEIIDDSVLIVDNCGLTYYSKDRENVLCLLKNFAVAKNMPIIVTIQVPFKYEYSELPFIDVIIEIKSTREDIKNNKMELDMHTKGSNTVGHLSLDVYYEYCGGNDSLKITLDT